MTVFNLGSINIDMVIRVPRLPHAGETLPALGSWSGLGGKGANQSVAVAKARHRVVHIGMIGADGLAARNDLADFGVDVRHVRQVDGPTGRAIVTVDPSGENNIIILSGANLFQSETVIREAFGSAVEGDTLLLQNETSLAVYAARHAKANGMRVIYSAAPFDVKAVREILPYLSILIVNEVEAEQLQSALERSIDQVTVPHIVVTRGAAGATLYDTGQGTATKFPTLEVEAIDTTGAGDTFSGYLAAGLDMNFPWQPSMQVALAAAALSTTVRGTSNAIPDVLDVKRAIYQQFGVKLPGVDMA